MIRCYEDELIGLAQIEDGKVYIDEISEQHKVGEVFSIIRSKMPFKLNFKFTNNLIFRMLLVLIPVFVVKVKSNKYACIGNHRSLQIARNANFGNRKIPVKLMINNNDELVRHMILIDTIVMPLLFMHCNEKKSIVKKVDALLRQIEGVGLTNGLKSSLRANNKDKNMYVKSSLFPVYEENMKDILTDDCIRLLVEMYPIYISVNDEKNEAFIGNEFVFKICSELFLNRTNVPCRKIFRMDNSREKVMHELSFLLPGYIFGLGVNGYSHFGLAIDKLSRDDKAWIFKQKITNKYLCEFINCSDKSLRKYMLTFNKANIKYENNEDLEKYNIKINNEV